MVICPKLFDTCFPRLQSPQDENDLRDKGKGKSKGRGKGTSKGKEGTQGPRQPGPFEAQTDIDFVSKIFHLNQRSTRK